MSYTCALLKDCKVCVCVARDIEFRQVYHVVLCNHTNDVSHYYYNM